MRSERADPAADGAGGSSTAGSTSTQLPRGNWRFGWILAAVWLVYLTEPLSRLLDDATGWRRVLGLGGLAGFVAVYLLGIAYFRRLRLGGETWLAWRAWAQLLAMAGCAAAMLPGAHESTLTAAPFLAAMMVMLLTKRMAIAAIGVLFVLTEGSTHIVSGWADRGYGLSVVLAAIATSGFRLAFQRNQALLLAQEEIAELAMEEERSRIARDLHDILGHSLTVITVKAELAQRLVDVDLERTRAELADLERLSRDALADVRATAMGVRGVSLLGEIAQARSALESAGIDAELPTVADQVPGRWRELFAWTIRECVTNVIRHSRAGTCVVEMSAQTLRVCDDGVGMPPIPSDRLEGHGLAGLRQRVERAGAAFHTGPGPAGEGFEVLVQVPS